MDGEALWRKAKVALSAVMAFKKHPSSYKREGDASFDWGSGRQELAEHPDIVQRLERFWGILDLLKDTHGNLTEQGYMVLNVKVQRALVSDFDLSEAQADARADWARDHASGADADDTDGMDIIAFRHSMFELVDLWTDSVDPADYNAFLDMLLESVVVDVTADELSLKPDDGIHFVGADWKSPTSASFGAASDSFREEMPSSHSGSFVTSPPRSRSGSNYPGAAATVRRLSMKPGRRLSTTFGTPITYRDSTSKENALPGIQEVEAQEMEAEAQREAEQEAPREVEQEARREAVQEAPREVEQEVRREAEQEVRREVEQAQQLAHQAHEVARPRVCSSELAAFDVPAKRTSALHPAYAARSRLRRQQHASVQSGAARCAASGSVPVLPRAGRRPSTAHPAYYERNLSRLQQQACVHSTTRPIRGWQRNRPVSPITHRPVTVAAESGAGRWLHTRSSGARHTASVGAEGAAESVPAPASTPTSYRRLYRPRSKVKNSPVLPAVGNSICVPLGTPALARRLRKDRVETARKNVGGAVRKSRRPSIRDLRSEV